MMELAEAIAAARSGDCILFTGAGFSLGAESVDGGEFPTAKEFARRIAMSVGLTDEYPLDVISDYVMQDTSPEGLGEHGLLSKIISTFSVRNTSSAQDVVSSLPWRRVYTTNYDLVFEVASSKSGHSWTAISTNTAPTGLKGRCIHINGHVHDLSINNLKTQIKLTHSSYASDSFAESQWASQFRSDISVARAIFFVGYSMADLDIARIMFQSPNIKGKVFFIVREGAPPIETAILSKYGAVNAIGLDRFAELILQTPAAPHHGDHVFSWLVRQGSAPSEGLPSDRDVIELLTLGDVKSEYVALCQANKDVKYIIQREIVSDIFSEIEGGKSWFLVHSSLGNGKTILKHAISHYLMSAGFDVYFDSDFEFADDYDVYQISKTTRKTAILVDESFNKLKTIEKLRAADNKFNIFIVFSRTAIYELDEARYLSALPIDVRVFDVNKLASPDIVSLRAMMDELGLWGARSSESFSKKESYIKNDCNSEMVNVIISIFENTEIGNKIKLASQSVLQKRDDVSNIITLAFLMETANTPPSLSLISDILNIDAWKVVSSVRFSEARDFLYVRNNEIATRSSIIAKFLLRNSMKPEMILNQIYSFIERFDKLRIRDQRVQSLFKEFQRFAFLEPLVNTPRKRELLIGFYQKAKTLPGCSRNPLFWLQYAIAQLSFERFEDAKIYFESAYSFANSGQQIYLRDIDNHYTRFLLESRTKSDLWDDYYGAFREAHEKIFGQVVKGDNRHYPYDRAKLYVEFIATRGKYLTRDQLKIFASSCRQILQVAETLSGELSKSPRVNECIRAMGRAIEIATELQRSATT